MATMAGWTGVPAGASAAPAEPDGAPRLPSLDVLRGVAILGILFMNINSMGASRVATAGGGDVRWIGWGPADQVAWWLRETLATGTARCLLEFLFGAGVVILTGRLADAAGQGAGGRIAFGRFLRRNVVLFGFGVVHLLLLLWPGDILHTYAVAALVIYPLRRLRPRWLVALGLSYALFGTVYGTIQTVRVRQDNAAYARALADRAAGRPLTAAERRGVRNTLGWHREQRAIHARYCDEVRRRSGSFRAWAGLMWFGVGTQLSLTGEPFHVWEAACAMLIGAALFKLGVLQAQRSRRCYLALAAAGYAAGLVIRIDVGAVMLPWNDDVPLLGPLREWGRLAVTLGHVGLIGALLSAPAGRRLLAPFAAAGRTALSLYVLQTLICLWLLYPPFALGLFGRQGWAALMGTAALIDAGLLLLANWWVRRYPIAPVEWAWRSLAAGRRLPFRRRAAAALAGPALA